MKKIFMVIMFLSALPALANMQVLKDFKTRYPEAKTLQNCKTCHTSGPQLNPYGLDLAQKAKSFEEIENFDSDGDGFTNLQEIQAGFKPGDKDSTPPKP